MENQKEHVIFIEKDFDNSPKRTTIGSGGYDLKSNENISIPAFSWKGVNTGIKVDIAKLNYSLLILPRSGLALKSGVSVLNSPGLIDSDYNQEIKVILINHNSFTYFVKKGDRIAQIILVNTLPICFQEVDNISSSIASERVGGFGSTGK